MGIDKLLEATVKNKGSDLHIRVGVPPKVRIRGHLRSLGKEPITSDDSFTLVKEITPEENMKELLETGSTDFSMPYKNIARFRVSAFRHQGIYGIVLRQIPNEMLGFEQIGLPPIVKDLCTRERGLFLVTGPTGSGKTTTLTSMIDYINEIRQDHIITLEDPIEFVHPHKKCIITQRQIGTDAPSFAESLRRALRQDPDIILVGEMRDLETITAAITAAETGHLVFGTLHTTSASKTVNRLIDAFPTTQQDQIRAQLSVSMLGVLSQALINTKDGKGRIAAYELMICTPAIQNLIREGEAYKIDGIIQTCGRMGMQLLEDHLFTLYSNGIINREDAISKANYPDMVINKIDGQ